jgi:guanosine-3',5'-bis(diphosphate) 3'-pyrophosphohydrolase
MGLVEKAKQFAAEAHGTQKYGKQPYAYHLQSVSDVLGEFGYHDDSLQAAAWLHDVLEDTRLTYEDLIRAGLPVVVATYVQCVTAEGAQSRGERNRLSYKKIKKSPEATVLKLADRIANVRECIANKDPRLRMYRSEYAEFRTALMTGDQGARKMWRELDELLEWG